MATQIQVSWAQLELPNARPGYPPKYEPSNCRAYRKKVPQCSDKPIRYASGEIDLKVTDLASSGFGVPWGHTRSFASQLSQDTDAGNGYNWQVQEWSYLVFQDDGSIAVMGDALETEWFDLVGSNYVPRFTVHKTLLLDTADNVYQLYDLDGSITEYSATTGAFQQHTDPAGNTVAVVSYFYCSRSGFSRQQEPDRMGVEGREGGKR